MNADKRRWKDLFFFHPRKSALICGKISLLYFVLISAIRGFSSLPPHATHFFRPFIPVQ
jgi:hypothetical protein